MNDLKMTTTGHYIQQQPPLRDVTPESLIAAQKNTELGAWVCSNWAGAYDVLTELYQAMYDANIKQMEEN